jgi:peptidoglycan/LPS O-acetylase OafA/YrhL
MNARATRFPLFDSLRAIAALCIFGTHAYAVLAADRAGWFREAARHLDVGVYIFFAISGFLLYRPFVRARLRDETPPAARAYGWRRLLRIGPAYWVALTVIAIWLPLGEVNDLDKAPWFYLFGQSYRWQTAIGGLSQAWSLCVEAGFYVFLPLYALLMRSLPIGSRAGRFRAELSGLVVLVGIGFTFTAFALHEGADTDWGQPALHLMMPAYLHQFAVGMGLAVLTVWHGPGTTPRLLRPLDRHPGIAWAAALVGFWFVSTQIGLDARTTELVTGPQYQARTALYALIALCIVLPAVFGDPTQGLVRRILANRALLWIGLVSYSFFLYHVFVLTELNRVKFTGSNYVWLVVGLALSLAVAAGSYYVIERPFIGLKRLVGSRREPARDEAIAEPAPVAPPQVTS